MKVSTRILLVEDEASTAPGLQAQLEGFGHEVVGIAVDAVSALELCRDTEPDMALVDLRLAHGDSGIDVAARILAERRVAIVFVASHSDDGAVEAALALSPMGWLVKPFRGAELRATVAVARQQFEALRSAAGHARKISECEQRLSMALAESSRQAREDPLTRIGNRRALDEALRRECGRLQRRGGSLVLLLMDVDWLRSYNDRYGRRAGDECLRLIAGVIAASAGRAADVIARHGADEFAVLLPDTAMRGALTQMERILEEVRDLAIPHAASPIGHITLSIGGVVASARARVAPERLVDEAEAALRRVKRGNRDCSALVVLSDSNAWRLAR